MTRKAYGVGAVVGTLAVVAILAVVALISQRAFTTWDLTANKRQSLSPESRRALEGLAQDVRLLAFYLDPQQGAGQEAQDLLRQYANASPRIKYEMIDPQRQVGLTREYKVETSGTVVVESGQTREAVTVADEARLTNAILKVTRGGTRKAYFLTGHGERSIEEPGERGLSRLRGALEGSSYQVAALSLATQAAVPDDADIVVVAGPRGDVPKGEIDRLSAYLKRGGHVLVLADLPEAPTPELSGLLRSYGIELRDSILVEPNSPADERIAVLDTFGPHPVTSGLANRGFFALMPLARPVIPADQPPAGVELTWLARSTASSWATPIDVSAGSARISLRFDARRDQKGPVTVAVAATLPGGGQSGAQAAASPVAGASPVAASSPATAPSPAVAPAAEQKRGRLVVVGDVDFASDLFFTHPPNRELAVGAVGWLASQDAVVSIAERTPTAQPLFLTPGQLLVAFLVWLGLPALATAAGIGSWLFRRRRHA
jgi:ABC-type uncharacterized transport system involved in gliding motility auxiliary subunit